MCIFSRMPKIIGACVFVQTGIFSITPKSIWACMFVQTDVFGARRLVHNSRRAPRAGAARERPRDENLRCQKNVWAGHSGDSQTEE